MREQIAIAQSTNAKKEKATRKNKKKIFNSTKQNYLIEMTVSCERQSFFVQKKLSKKVFFGK
ncbi:MAG: hypothetical protein RSB10_03090, partial [Clostridia bacterium]